MAIQVSGTTVINDSRSLTNISSVDSVTGAALSNAGLGGGGGLPSSLGVGAYAHGRPANNSAYNAGNTASGFNAFGVTSELSGDRWPKHDGTSFIGMNGSNQAASGTWMAMTKTGVSSGNGYGSLWLRIS
jgi:hypothetical protein